MNVKMAGQEVVDEMIDLAAKKRRGFSTGAVPLINPTRTAPKQVAASIAEESKGRAKTVLAMRNRLLRKNRLVSTW